MRSVKEESTGRMIFFGRPSLERALAHYMAHYHEERHHQGLQNRLLKCSDIFVHQQFTRSPTRRLRERRPVANNPGLTTANAGAPRSRSFTEFF